mmetsp:Transcript_20137/g.57142  ORF Transcript_20137/g.57142 Transcript_20137/m.57142 type:complete len:235 (-) Transcript_20137:462-1166(-)
MRFSSSGGSSSKTSCSSLDPDSIMWRPSSTISKFSSISIRALASGFSVMMDDILAPKPRISSDDFPSNMQRSFGTPAFSMIFPSSLRWIRESSTAMAHVPSGSVKFFGSPHGFSASVRSEYCLLGHRNMNVVFSGEKWIEHSPRNVLAHLLMIHAPSPDDTISLFIFNSECNRLPCLNTPSVASGPMATSSSWFGPGRFVTFMTNSCVFSSKDTDVTTSPLSFPYLHAFDTALR